MGGRSCSCPVGTCASWRAWPRRCRGRWNFPLDVHPVSLVNVWVYSERGMTRMGSGKDETNPIEPNAKPRFQRPKAVFGGFERAPVTKRTQCGCRETYCHCGNRKPH